MPFVQAATLREICTTSDHVGHGVSYVQDILSAVRPQFRPFHLTNC